MDGAEIHMNLLLLRERLADPDILTVKEVAAFLKFNSRTVYVLAKQGKIPATRVGRGWCFSRAALERYVRGRLQSLPSASDRAYV